MKSISEIAKEQNLTEAQQQAIEAYVAQLVVELLETLKQDTIVNFDETIKVFSS
ncbi:MAG: hypothetical protein WC686_02460 [Candidatus Shapirobacteria bacterium]|jgi:hypothetical protein